MQATRGACIDDGDGGRRHRGLRPGPHPRGGRAGTGRPTQLADPDRRDIPTQGGLGGAPRPARGSATTPGSSSTATTTTGSPPSPTGWPGSTAPRRRRADERRAQEVGGGGPAADHRRPAVSPAPATGPGARPDLRLPRRRARTRRRARARALVDVRSPAEFNGEIIAPPGLPETAQRGGHIPGAPTSPGPRLPTRTAPSSPPTSCGALRRQGHHRGQGRSSPTAGSASARPTPGSC